jgi:hypothetical protein
MISNTYTEKFVAGVLAVTFMVPALAFAQETTTTSTANPREAKAFCSNVPTFRAKALARLTERVVVVQGKKTDRQAQFAVGRTERTAKLTAGRSDRDANREARYANIRSRASTTEQTAAVNTFATEIERLVTIRKAAVDTAIKNFEDAAAVLQTANNAKVTDFSVTMQADINQIYDAAVVSCAAGKNGPEVMAEVKASMEAKRALRVSEKAIQAPREQFKALQATRKAAVEAAKATFQTGMDVAATDLKAAFAQ